MVAILRLETASPDWFGVGIVLAIAGSFLLANAILFRHPRNLVAEHFGRGISRLSSIREYIFHRLQVHLGFFFLLAGFGFQLYGHYRPGGEPGGERSFPTLWVGVVLVAGVLLEIVGWWLSHWLFRKYVREYFLAHPPDLDTNLALARELGELFGIRSALDDSVPAYLARVRSELGLPRAGRSTVPRPTAELPLGEEADEGA
ncbi:MAG: hypothetical protein AB1726_08820 [Planctomycetota bacterium]